MDDKEKSRQLYELAKNVLPYLSYTKRINGLNFKLEVSHNRASYVYKDQSITFKGDTTLDACKKMLEWSEDYKVTKKAKL